MNNFRKKQALETRVNAAELAFERVHPEHQANGDELKFYRDITIPNTPRRRGSTKTLSSYMASFAKGLKHDFDTGLVANPDNFQQMINGIDSGDPRDFIDTPLGPCLKANGSPDWLSKKAQDLQCYEDCNNTKVCLGANVRAWESQAAGLLFDLQGPDAGAVTMPPAPAFGSDELIAEMGEVYAQALLRDVSFTDLVEGEGQHCRIKHVTTKRVVKELNELAWFKGDCDCTLTPAEQSRKRGSFTFQNVFRGITRGDDIGPYISQFMLSGNVGLGKPDLSDEQRVQERAKGFITYGAMRMDQRARVAVKGNDHMTNYKEWFDVQNGADLRRLEAYTDDCNYRFITTPRDLATYVHYDALYQAYLNACLILLELGAPLDPGIPFTLDDEVDHQQGFAHFGGPHILSLVTEVATRALKAVRYQKFNIHRRLRPEALAARLAKHHELKSKELDAMIGPLKDILRLVEKVNGSDPDLKDNFLLPMAFCEGSPMHPSYGAGHATVAGACVTILKAFFDHSQPLRLAGDEYKAFVPNADGSSLDIVSVDCALTVEGELNKLASNISIGRDWAGVHYFSDYIESIRMGEKIAIGILEEQKLTYGENFSMTVPLFDGGSVRI